MNKSNRKTIEQIIRHYGGPEGARKRFGYTDKAAIYNWRRRGLPAGKLFHIHFDTGIELKRIMRAQAQSM